MASSHRTLIVLQPTTFCNIDCQYCYLPHRGQTTKMTLDVVRRVATEVLSSDLLEEPFNFLWHLGEPLAIGQDFYEEAFAEIARINEQYQRKYILSYQTNATLLNEKWIKLIQKYDVKIGLSLDGPAFIHDRLRITRNKRGTHGDVMRGVRLLQKNAIPFSVIAVLTDYTLDYPDEFFQFYFDNHIDHVAYNIDEIEGSHTVTTFSNDNVVQRYKGFLHRLLELIEQQQGAIVVREVVSNLNLLTQTNHSPYNTTNRPLRILNVHYNGNITTFTPELVSASSEKYHNFIMGNILEDTLADLLNNSVFQQTHREIEEGIALCKQTCAYWDYCGGGSPASKFFEHGRFDVAETTTCRIHKKATIDVLVDYVEAKTRRTLPMLQSTTETLRN